MISKSADPPCNFSDPRIPHTLRRQQGSITIESISPAAINDNEVETPILPTPMPLPASPVPHSTLVDVLGKYAERQQQKQEKFIFSEQYLIANSYCGIVGATSGLPLTSVNT
jgi:hypothetical protein